LHWLYCRNIAPVRISLSFQLWIDADDTQVICQALTNAEAVAALVSRVGRLFAFSATTRPSSMSARGSIKAALRARRLKQDEEGII
jgi:hypothetical protein